MSKNIIISGPPASGKSHIAQAIMNTHRKACKVYSPDFFSTIRTHPDLIIDKNQCVPKYDLITIDECRISEIGILCEMLNENTSKVFITQGRIDENEIDTDKFFVINLYRNIE